MLKYLKPGRVFLALTGSVILAFGLYNVHSFSGVTEGGVLGMTLLLHYWFHLSPALSGLIMNGACYLLGWKVLGKDFVLYSIIAGGAPGGDDALAMSLSHLLEKKIQWVYLASDLIVLVLSLSYIPLNKIAYSLLTVLLSGQIIGWIQKLPLSCNAKGNIVS